MFVQRNLLTLRCSKRVRWICESKCPARVVGGSPKSCNMVFQKEDTLSIAFLYDFANRLSCKQIHLFREIGRRLAKLSVLLSRVYSGPKAGVG